MILCILVFPSMRLIKNYELEIAFNKAVSLRNEIFVQVPIVILIIIILIIIFLIIITLICFLLGHFLLPTGSGFNGSLCEHFKRCENNDSGRCGISGIMAIDELL